ncbi:MAG TPA: hypothetical protein PLZ95_01735 [Bryobacteraceae bacterium]|nr:hypothetical protein [Bryobacteraceae bacterium]
MIGRVLLVVIGLLLVANGILMMADPARWARVHNVVFGYLQGKDPWFELDPNKYERGVGRAGTQAAGLVSVFIGLLMLAGLLASIN